MKTTILINQAGIVAAGLADNTDLIDWAIIDYVHGLSRDPHAECRRFDGANFPRLNAQQLLDDMPMLGINSRSGVARRLTKLYNLGLLSVYADKRNNSYARLTELAMAAVNG